MQFILYLECSPLWEHALYQVAEAAGLRCEHNDGQLRFRCESMTTHPAGVIKAAPALWQEMRDLVEAVAGALVLGRLAEPNEIALKNIKYIDDTGEEVWMRITGGANIRIPMTQLRPDDIAVTLLAESRTNPSAAKVARLWNSPPDWSNLYRVYEIVAHAVGGEKAITQHGWANASTRTAFRASANQPSVSGDRARHGITTGRPAETMTLPEASDFVRELVIRWLSCLRRESAAQHEN